MIVYISGRITGNQNYLQDFQRAEVALSDDHVVINPCTISPYKESKTWSDYMREDIMALCNCDAIYMLKCWWRSKGARLEYKIAKSLGLKIMYEV